MRWTEIVWVLTPTGKWVLWALCADYSFEEMDTWDCWVDE